MRTAVVLLALVWASAAPAAQSGPVLLIDRAGKPLRLQLDIQIDGKSPERTWEAFLDRLFDHFDRDGDGRLSASEVGRMFPLPLPDGRELAPTFAHMAESNGKVSRQAFKTYCRKGGCTPIVTLFAPPNAEIVRAGQALFRHLDSNRDGRLTRQELARAGALLRKLDEDDDEVLTLTEVLVGAATAPKASTALRWTRPEDIARPDAVIRLTLGKGAAAPVVLPGASKEIEVQPRNQRITPFRLRARDVELTADESDSGAFAAIRQFYLAQFKTILGDNGFVRKEDLQADASAQVLVDLFAAADRNGDSKLTLKEMEAFLDLIQQGIAARAVVVVADRGRNLFDALDANRDGRLDLGELNRAVKVLGDRSSTTIDQTPRQLRLSWRRGVVGDSFGPLPLPARRAQPGDPPARMKRGPRWFQAMDRNGDGYLSPREFLGSPARFRQLDTDGDGRISVEAAEQADKRKAGGRP